MDVIGAKYAPFSSFSWGRLAGRLRGWRCAGVVFCQPLLLEHMENKARSILCSLLLLGVIFVSICPITDGLDENPIDFIAMGCRIDACPLHFSSDGFRLNAKEFL